ncbi:hypothetical protein ACQI4E_27745 [Streptomyces sp. CA-252508]|uniref:hypothetical protein n=1 Tax=Streptomyces sp. CA-252508 TaxID=3418946 RepID=UPI003D92ADC0
MSGDIPHDTEDVGGVLTERIETRFEMGMNQLKVVVALEPTANPDATEVVN